MCNRLLNNRAIVKKLSELIEKYPDLRFGQLLVDCDIIRYGQNVLVNDQRKIFLTIDPFNEESEITWNRMISNKFCFPDNN